MKKSDIKNKKILVVGMARSGLATVEVLCRQGAYVLCQDSKLKEEMDAEIVEKLDSMNVKYLFGEKPEELDFDLIVVSPGVPLYIDLLKEAKEKGIKIIGELELAYQLSSANFISITGTNGKTTTTTLVGEIFKKAGVDSSVGGNIGIPVILKAADAKKDSWLIVETSSFQAESIDEFHPRVSALLNLGPDHLDRHKTFEKYSAAKARIFENQKKEDYAVVNADDDMVMKFAPGIKATVVPFSRKRELDFGSFVTGGNIVIKNEAEELLKICKEEDLKIPGTHNLENALAAVAISYFAGIEPAVIQSALKAFAGVEHRIEPCGEIDGIKYFNDSKGTNPDAVIKAIQAMKSDIVLIAGGYDKGADYTEFVEAFGDKVKHVILMGKTAVKIKNACQKIGFDNTIIVKDMEDCVREATRLAVAGNTVLLSPACASWDMYNSFEERGRHFKECVRKMEK